jgi:3-hydroxybutyryl-CoA dehydrogenase
MAEIKVIGIVGAGTMGSGIAQVAAAAGYQVIMRDIAEGFVEKGLKAIEKNLSRMVAKEKITAEKMAEIMGRITGTVEMEKLAAAQMVIEAAVERMDIKKEIFKSLDTTCPPETILASNTSGLSITEMASATRRPGQVVGMHFFNPVPVMKLVEVVKGAATSEETYAAAMEVCKIMGKEAITVNEAPLFAVNRILCPMLNEAIFVLAEGIASAEDIDKGMMLGANHPIGPLALADLVGLDVMLLVMDNLYEETGDSKYRTAPLLRKMVRAGYLGRKSGRGFYTYN